MGWEKLFNIFHKPRRDLPLTFFSFSRSSFTNPTDTDTFLLSGSVQVLQIPQTDRSLLPGSVQGGRHLPRRLGQKDDQPGREGDAWTHVSQHSQPDIS